MSRQTASLTDLQAKLAARWPLEVDRGQGWRPMDEPQLARSMYDRDDLVLQLDSAEGVKLSDGVRVRLKP